MKYIVSYDISCSKNRKELSDYLISNRFIRIQKSVFLGNVNLHEIEKMKEKCNEFSQEEKDSIMFCPICIEDIFKSIFLGQTFDMEDLEKFKDFIFY